MSADRTETRRLAQLVLDYRAAEPRQRWEIAATIRERYATERTVLIGDMAGFTRRVEAADVVPFVALIFEMRKICEPLVEAQGGYLFKTDADNVFAAFSEPVAGLDCAVAIQLQLERANATRPHEERIEIGLALACGEVLAIGGEDVWGLPINLASKLGEDLAEAGEVLADKSMLPALESRNLDREQRSCVLSGVQLDYFSVSWRKP